MFYGLYLKINANLSRKERGARGGGGEEERRERGNLLLISAFPSSGAGAAGEPRPAGTAAALVRGAQGRPEGPHWWLRASLRALLPPKFKHPHTPSYAADTPAVPASPREGSPPPAHPKSPAVWRRGRPAELFTRVSAGRGCRPAGGGGGRRARREGGVPGGAAGSREKSAALCQGRGHRWLPRPTETICLLQMVWKVIKVGACMKIIDNV